MLTLSMSQCVKCQCVLRIHTYINTHIHTNIVIIKVCFMLKHRISGFRKCSMEQSASKLNGVANVASPVMTSHSALSRGYM